MCEFLHELYARKSEIAEITKENVTEMSCQMTYYTAVLSLLLGVSLAQFMPPGVQFVNALYQGNSTNVFGPPTPISGQVEYVLNGTADFSFKLTNNGDGYVIMVLRGTGADLSMAYFYLFNESTSRLPHFVLTTFFQQNAIMLSP